MKNITERTSTYTKVASTGFSAEHEQRHYSAESDDDMYVVLVTADESGAVVLIHRRDRYYMSTSPSEERKFPSYEEAVAWGVDHLRNYESAGTIGWGKSD